MQLISYVSQTFASAQTLYEYLRDNVSWWDSTADDKLVKDNIEITLTGSSLNAFMITETSGGQSKSSAAISSNNTAIVLITDDTLAVDISTSTGHQSFIVGKATDGTNEHYGAVFSVGNATNCLCYGDVTAPNKSYTPITSATNVQFIPVYSWTTAYHMENAYTLFISPNTLYLGKLTLNDKKYVQVTGLALEYIE